ncbi:MAG TPA: 16S rRNA (cytidine(1402)-2'-O)-methyltransferase [Bacteroidia bacterium]|nr:16S rRNA (cytidine(1402)-2'-O)-methyltransferase [Bacteroidia bacterium]HNT79554.1 16S rRNA (cytidine(1402)-2'-O)-methyltransferase [Bacteroidia bacterium]
MNGKLFIVATPIGNLEDITFRALRVLKEVDQILAEDTRTSSVLLKHYNISAKAVPYHNFNEHKSIAHIIRQLKNGMQMALISDAGTPSISDPGFLLVRACVEENIPVECLPGASALIPALVVSGFPSDAFVFEGFLPHKKGRQTKLKMIAQEERTVVLYESPHRLLKTLEQLKEFVEEDRWICVVRELTKIHEEVQRGNVKELIAHFNTHAPRGEIVLIIATQKFSLRNNSNE